MAQDATVTWLTQEAFDRLAGELEQLSTHGREEIAKRIEAAREEGDLKENGGYHAAKDEQGKQEARIRQLTQLLRTAQVGEAPQSSGVVEPGTRGGEKYEPPVIESVRTLRRLSPDDVLDFHVVAEVTQRVRRHNRWFFGGSTVVLDEVGRIRFVIGKGIRNQSRRKQFDAFLKAAPAEYRTAFERDEWNSGALVKRFHARHR